MIVQSSVTSQLILSLINYLNTFRWIDNMDDVSDSDW